MRLDTSSPATLWKDRAVIEINAAVLYSFQVYAKLIRNCPFYNNSNILIKKETNCFYRGSPHCCRVLYEVSDDGDENFSFRKELY